MGQGWDGMRPVGGRPGISRRTIGTRLAALALVVAVASAPAFAAGASLDDSSASLRAAGASLDDSSASPVDSSASPVDSSASLGDYKVKDATKVYYGNSRLFRKPCVVSADRIYRRIPEYRKILDKGLTERDPLYHILMKKASARFREAVKQMARDMDHDLAAEKGYVEKTREEAKAVPDRTDEVIGNIR